MADQQQDAFPTSLDDRASFLLSSLGARSARAFTERLAPLGVQPSHFGLLMHLARENGQSQQQLADLLGIHRNVMVGLVDDLENRGLVERRRHPADRRAHAIHLTDSALTLLREANRLADEQDAQLFSGMTADDRTLLIGLLKRLARSVDDRPDVHSGLSRH
jgi:DNA-binding MarR family transcriptional regulator